MLEPVAETSGRWDDSMATGHIPIPDHILRDSPSQQATKKRSLLRKIRDSFSGRSIPGEEPPECLCPRSWSPQTTPPMSWSLLSEQLTNSSPSSGESTTSCRCQGIGRLCEDGMVPTELHAFTSDPASPSGHSPEPDKPCNNTATNNYTPNNSITETVMKPTITISAPQAIPARGVNGLQMTRNRLVTHEGSQSLDIDVSERIGDSLEILVSDSKLPVDRGSFEIAQDVAMLHGFYMNMNI